MFKRMGLAAAAAAAMMAGSAQAAVTFTLTFNRLADIEGDAGSITFAMPQFPNYSNQTIAPNFITDCAYARPADGLSGACFAGGQALYYPNTSGALFPANGGSDPTDAFGFAIPDAAETFFQRVDWWEFTDGALGEFGSYVSTDGRATLDITGFVEDGGAIPEPTTWALMIGGFGMAGAMLRRRRAAVA